MDDISHIFLVANVNVNPDGLNVNVNEFSNDNVWNAENGNRFVIPKLIISLALLQEFLFVDLFSSHPALFLFLLVFQKY